MIFHKTAVKVRFNEVDSYNVAWHGHYVSWMEIGRNDLAGRFGLDAEQLGELGYSGPVIGLEIKYFSPARFKDEIIVKTAVKRSETATLIFVNEIVDLNGKKLASGVTTHALTDFNGVLQFKMPLKIAERINKMFECLEVR